MPRVTSEREHGQWAWPKIPQFAVIMAVITVVVVITTTRNWVVVIQGNNVIYQPSK